ncbi:MAG: hypothetical protein AAF415_16065 [Pseudomonadota bacterium]
MSVQTFEEFDRKVGAVLMPAAEMARVEEAFRLDVKTRREFLKMRSALLSMQKDWAEEMLLQVVTKIPQDSQLTVRAVLALKSMFEKHFDLLIRGRFNGPFVLSLRRLGTFCLYHGIAPGPIHNGYSSVRDQVYDTFVNGDGGSLEEQASVYRLLTRWTATECFHIQQMHNQFWKIHAQDLLAHGESRSLPLPYRMITTLENVSQN